VRPLVDHIRGAGLAAWIDLHQPNPDQLDQVLEMCGCMVLCVSPSALKSKLVKTELDYFFEREKTIIPFICRKANLPSKLHRIPSFKYSQMASLIEHIKSLRMQSPFAKYEP